MTPPHNPDDIRIGTAERERAINALGEHFAAGRLDMSEYEHRVGLATAAQTAGELRALFADLPGPHHAPPVQFFPAAPPPPLVAPPATHVYYPLQPSDKSKVVAGVLQILLPFGVGRFYTGHVGLGLAQLLVTFFSCGIGALWSIIDGIILLASNGTDSMGRPLRS